MTSQHMLITLVLSLAALAFVVWMVIAYPTQKPLFGPAPADAIAVQVGPI